MTRDLDPALEIALQRAEQLVAQAHTVAFALDEIDAIELPPSAGAVVDQAQLRAIATLYLASELEDADVLGAAEALTRLARSGSLAVDLGEAARLLQELWRQRNERANEAERRGFFSALFGAPGGIDHSEQPPNREFEDRLIDLCEALYKLDEQASNSDWGGVAQQARVRAAAQRLLANLVRVSSGLTVFLAQEVLAAVKQALAILAHRAVKSAFGARDVWGVVAAVARLARRPRMDPALHVRRGQAGMTLLSWLAEAAPFLEQGGKPLVSLNHPVIPAAVDWLEASLALGESAAPAPPPARGESPWAALAG